MADLSRMKEMLQQPEHYTERHFRSECISCAFRSECQGEEVKKSKAEKNIVHLQICILFVVDKLFIIYRIFVADFNKGGIINER